MHPYKSVTNFFMLSSLQQKLIGTTSHSSCILNMKEMLIKEELYTTVLKFRVGNIIFMFLKEVC